MKNRFLKSAGRGLAAAVACLGLAGASVAQAAPNGIQIYSASYGSNAGAPHGNATYDLASSCNGQLICNYTVSIYRLGDPAYGYHKDFLAEYSCGGPILRIALPPEANGRRLTLNCLGNGPGPVPPPQPQGLRVLEATYGQNVRAPHNNALYDVAARCNGSFNCSYYVDVYRLGDPAYGYYKDFDVAYTCGGGLVRRAYVPAEANGRYVDLNCF